MATVRINVSVAEDDDVNAVASAVEGAGATIEQTLGMIGVITASVDEARLDAVRSLRGVTRVEAEGTYQLPPPDSKIQ